MSGCRSGDPCLSGRAVDSFLRILYLNERQSNHEGAPLILRRSCSHLFASLITLFAVLTFTSCSSNNKTASSAPSPTTSSPAAASATPGGGASSAGSSGEIDACKLVTKAEAEAA